MEEITWNLKSIIKDEKEFHQIIKEIENTLPKFDKFLKKLSPTMSEKDFKELITFQEKTGEKVTRIGAYIALQSAVDTKSQKVMKLQPLLENLSIKLGDANRPISHWIQGLEIENKPRLDDKNAKRLFNSIPIHTYSLNYERQVAKHSLPIEIEKIIQRKDINGINTIIELYEKITTNFSFEIKLKNKTIKIENQEELKKYIYSPNIEERKAAYEALFTPYKENKEILYSIYGAILKDWRMEQNMRKYPSAISIKNINNQLSDEVIDTLLKVCTKNRTVFQEVFKIKAKELGLKKLSRTDLYAPLEKSNKKYPFNKSKEIVFDVFNSFHKEFANKAELLFKEGHIDSHPRVNKRSGAFCMSITPDITPYVLLNHTNTIRDVSTIAHELGHAIHDLYSNHLPSSLTHASTPLAETASTFCEMLLFEELLKQTNPKERRILLMNKLADSYASILRQAYFTKFEIEAHKSLPDGLTEDELSNLWLKNLKEQFGSSVDIPDYFKYEWSYIPHIYCYPFYCYGYSFGDLLSLALYATYKKEGKDFIPKLERILSAGGSQDPQKLLMNEGFDISKPEFWESGFTILKDWVKELNKLK